MPTRSLKARSAFLCLALAVLAGAVLAGPAFAQEPQGIVRYRVVDDETGAESVARLDFGRLATGQTFVLLTQLLPPEAPGEPGTYKVFAGFAERGGLGNPYVRVFEAKDSFQMLKRPGVLLRNPAASLKPGFSCQIELGIPGLPFTCSDGEGSSQTGRILRLRPSPLPIPHVLQKDIPGYYRVVDEEGGEALARLEFKDQDFASQSLLTLFSPPEGPDALGTYKVFAGYVVPGAWSFQASVRELRNPFAVLRRPVLLPTLPEEALVPDFACGLSATSGGDAGGIGAIGYTCFDGGVLTQQGQMIRLR